MTPLFEKYISILGAEAFDLLIQKAARLKGLKLVHVNSTKEGGGVAEILKAMLPLSNALGIKTAWKTVEGNADFYACTKKFHNLLQGQKGQSVDSALLENYERINQENARNLKDVLKCADVVFVHDPQPASMVQQFAGRDNLWVWRCHIDTSEPDPATWNYLKNFINDFDASIFSLEEYVQPLSCNSYTIPPSIDPLSHKNIELEENEIDWVFTHFGIERKRPIVLQVSRFDRFKDPVGVMEAFFLAKEEIPDLQLILAGGGASDDPEGLAVLDEVKEASKNEKDVHVLFLPAGAHRVINALQRGADIVMQKSIKEGFGLTVAESLWKRKPVIGGNCGGIRLQILPDRSGYLVDSPQEAAFCICHLMRDPRKRKNLGQFGRDLVQQKYLINRHLADYLTVISDLYRT